MWAAVSISSIPSFRGRLKAVFGYEFPVHAFSALPNDSQISSITCAYEITANKAVPPIMLPIKTGTMN